MTLVLLADAARAAGASRVTAVVPYFGYARQDTRKSAGEPRSAQIVGKPPFAAGIDRLVTVELHSAALESAFQMPLVHLEADVATLPVIRAGNRGSCNRIARCRGRQKARTAMDATCPHRIAGRARDPAATAGRRRRTPDSGDVRWPTCLIVDDLSSTVRTIAMRDGVGLKRCAGAKGVHALFIHAVMAPEALARICAAPVQRIVTRHRTHSAHPRLHTVSRAPLLA